MDLIKALTIGGAGVGLFLFVMFLQHYLVPLLSRPLPSRRTLPQAQLLSYQPMCPVHRIPLSEKTVYTNTLRTETWIRCPRELTGCWAAMCYSVPTQGPDPVKENLV